MLLEPSLLCHSHMSGSRTEGRGSQRVEDTGTWTTSLIWSFDQQLPATISTKAPSQTVKHLQPRPTCLYVKRRHTETETVGGGVANEAAPQSEDVVVWLEVEP
ncbi:hypothetical protein GN956_G15474 [Arapaima gigas]